jgi:hypothetical protein
MFWGMNPPPCPPKIGLKRAKSFTPLSQWAMAPIEKKIETEFVPTPTELNKEIFSPHIKGVIVKT